MDWTSHSEVLTTGALIFTPSLFLISLCTVGCQGLLAFYRSDVVSIDYLRLTCFSAVNSCFRMCIKHGHPWQQVQECCSLSHQCSVSEGLASSDCTFSGSLLFTLAVFSVSVCRSNMACVDYRSPYVHSWSVPCPHCLLCIQRIPGLLIWRHSWIWLNLSVYIIVITVGHCTEPLVSYLEMACGFASGSAFEADRHYVCTVDGHIKIFIIHTCMSKWPLSENVIWVYVCYTNLL